MTNAAVRVPRPIVTVRKPAEVCPNPRLPSSSHGVNEIQHDPIHAGHNESVADHFFTPKELSGFLAVPVETLRWYRRNGIGPDYVQQGRLIRYRRSAVDAWAAAHTVRSA